MLRRPSGLWVPDYSKRRLCSMSGLGSGMSGLTLSSGTRGATGGGVTASTFDPTKKSVDITLSNGNLTADNTAFQSRWAAVLGTTGKTAGKVYVELLQGAYNSLATSVDNILYAFTQDDLGGYNNPAGAVGDGGFTRASNAGSGPGSSGIVSANAANVPSYVMNPLGGDILQLALDFDAGKGWVGYNNTYGGSPVAGTNPLWTWAPAGTWYYAWSRFSESANGSPVTVKAASGSQSFSPPAGFSAWG